MYRENEKTEKNGLATKYMFEVTSNAGGYFEFIIGLEYKLHTEITSLLSEQSGTVLVFFLILHEIFF